MGLLNTRQHQLNSWQRFIEIECFELKYYISVSQGTMKSIFLSGIIQGVLLAVLLLIRGKEHRPNRILGLLMVVVSVHLSLIMFEGSDFFSRNPHFSRITWLLPILYGPLILLFTKMVTQRREAFIKTDLMVFIPFGLYLILLIPYYVSSVDQKLFYMNDENSLYSDDFGLINQLSNGLHLAFIGISIFVYHKNTTLWKEVYSGMEIIRIKWLLSYLYITLAIILVSVIVFYAKKFSISPLSILYPYHFFGIVILIYWIGYKALIKPEIFGLGIADQVEEPLVKEALRYETFLLDAEPAREIRNKMNRAMETDKLFLNPDLSLSQLADHIVSSRHHISQVLNVFMATNFYDYINNYRILEFKKKLDDPASQNYTLLGLAQESGFNSKTTFNAVFKKNTGMTPSEYYRNLKNAGERRPAQPNQTSVV